ncbi:MAG: CotH kinase family protein [Oscillospiraceae bacterium]|nr:CotH kinase family protein [Oscillospiraceae bacterium]
MTKRLIILIVLIALTLTGVLALNYSPVGFIGLPVSEEHLAGEDALSEEPPEEDEDLIIEIEDLWLEFSHAEHFYTEYIEVEIISSVKGTIIHYTTDGSEPTTDSPIYEEPVPLYLPTVKHPVAVYPLKAIAVYEEFVTRPLVHTYFLSEDVHDRFNVMVFSLSTNDEYLFDHDIGIFVEGATRAEWRRNNRGVQIIPPSPANFNWRGMESERPLYIEAFEINGERVIAQLGGVRVHGGWSRAANQKSMRLVARNMYEPGQGRFRYDFFPDDVKADGFDSPIRRYDQLILSNNANDRDFAMLRQEVNYALARESGFRVVSPMRAAAIFLNGEYYGFAWLEVRINDRYLQDIFSAPTSDFQIIGRGEWWVDTDDEKDQEDMAVFNSFYDKDFNNDAIFKEFGELVDIENLLHYYAYQTYVGNRDWPGGNLRRWRYIGPQEENLAPELDGRWRYVLYDLDFLMALYEEPRPQSPSFRDYMRHGGDRYSYMLAAILQRPEMADRYAMYICDIATNIVTKENVAREIDRLYKEAHREIGFALEANRYAGWVSHDSIEHNHENMLIYVEHREVAFMNSLTNHFGWDNEYFTVTVSGGDAVIGTMPAKSSKYLAHLKIPVRPVLSGFTVFDHWIINGETKNTPELTVSIADARDGVVSIELVTREEYPALMITDLYSTPERNGLSLINTTEETINTSDLFLTNNLSDPFLWQIPAALIAPGDTLDFAGRGSSHPSELMKIRMGFNARIGRTIYLCDEDGNVIHWMHVG